MCRGVALGKHGMVVWFQMMMIHSISIFRCWIQMFGV